MAGPDNTRLSQDVVFDLLSNPRRRFLLRELQEADGGAELDDLAAALAASENQVPVEELTAKQEKRTYVSLYQTHIPKMAEAGVLRYDRDEGRVSLTDRSDELMTYLRTPSETPRWEVVYSGVAIAGIVLYSLTVLIDPGFPDGIHVGISFFLVVLGVSVLHHLYTIRENGRSGAISVDRG